MNRQRLLWLAAGFVVCLLVGGLIYWQGSYQDYLQTGFPWGAVAVIAGIAFVLAYRGAGVVASTLVIGAAFPAVIMARVAMDTLQDPTSHNLWPIEVGFAFITGPFMALPGACVGGILRRFTNREPAKVTDSAPV